MALEPWPAKPGGRVLELLLEQEHHLERELAREPEHRQEPEHRPQDAVAVRDKSRERAPNEVRFHEL